MDNENNVTEQKESWSDAIIVNYKGKLGVWHVVYFECVRLKGWKRNNEEILDSLIRKTRGMTRENIANYIEIIDWEGSIPNDIKRAYKNHFEGIKNEIQLHIVNPDLQLEFVNDGFDW